MGVNRFFRRRYWDDERRREIETYLAHEIDDNVDRGLSPDEARRAAYRKLGNPSLIREQIYEMNSVRWLEHAWQDLRYGARLLRRNPTFAVIAVLTLALGTGANTSIFQLMNAVWLRTLPVERPQDLMEVKLVPQKGSRSGSRTGRYPVLSAPEWNQLRSRQTVFSSLAAWGTARFDIARGGPMQRIEGIWVSGTFFDTLGVQAFRGRTISPADDRSACASPGIVVSHAFWQRQFGGDEAIIGRTLSLDGHPFEIIGITPPHFRGVEVGRSFDVAAPLCAVPTLVGPPNPLEQTTFWFLGAIGRLAPGVSIRQAIAQLAALSPSLYQATLPSNYDSPTRQKYLELTLTAAPAGTGVSVLRQQYLEPMWILLGTTALVLVIACANLANLMLARATTRTREIAVRLAIGASRGRVVRQLVAESLVISALGAAAGLLVSRVASTGLIALLGGSHAEIWLDVAPDARVFAFTIAIAVVACLIFGLTPAVRATAVAPGAGIRIGARGATDSPGRFSLRSALVVAQFALSVVLVVGALLFARTFRNLAAENAGFKPENVVTAPLDLSRVHVPADPGAMFHDRLVARVRAIPGVTAAAEASILPLSGSGWNERIVISGAESPTLPMFNSVTPGFFATMHSAIVAGRDFRPADVPGAKVVIVNRTFANTFFAGGNPIGRTFEVVTPVGTPHTHYTIIGVVEDSKYSDLRQPFVPIAYVDMEQIPDTDSGPILFVRTSLPLASASEAVADAVSEVDPRISLRFQTLQGVIDDSLSRERLMATLSGVFGGLAALIAMIGLYGVMSYVVARRRVEIGVRMALGADARTVLRMVLRDAGALLLPGVAIGGVLAVAAARATTALLYGIEPWDPTTLALATGALVVVAFVATWVPAHRAALLNPTMALREE